MVTAIPTVQLRTPLRLQWVSGRVRWWLISLVKGTAEIDQRNRSEKIISARWSKHLEKVTKHLQKKSYMEPKIHKKESEA